ncbi:MULTISPECIES: oxidoreductase [unclassified Brenneria]|uniref:oxidoreductase n=1 Tax=unclassified Brenneria TaxID=2634434 RepID=UPI0018F0E7FC|nr:MULTISPECIES: FAD-dependent oxidoreductase [unclassified Brenneria]MBJ7222151.1 FAD-dependent oxidoreductase [Brenneria sp. L3-3C-1]MEE3643394.1 FAD-dependent oxidoreductase [Brenneria sp. L3_3C_1]MEE3651579.1 FAD-dependent oxidoreductase [Brenneria sp. HEZEL_4_2_4]
MYKKLFEPKRINQCVIPNRLVVTAMVANYCNTDGTSSDRYIAYHEEKAKGGWGLIITEDYAVNEHAMGYQYIAGLWNDEQIASHKKLTDTIHRYDSKIFAQIYHAGRQSNGKVNGGVQPMAPSPIPCPWLREMPRELSIEDIQNLVKDFGNCAKRVKQAGFDGVEIHAGHGYLIAEFLSPYVNKRVDKYGGCLDNRVRFLKEIYQEVRSNVGPDFPVMVRFSAYEGFVGGRDISESRVLAQLFEEWGVDALDVSVGAYGDHNKFGTVSPMYVGHAWTVPFAEEIKKLVNIPVITANRINDPRMADSILSMGKADFIGMGRGSLADPHLPNKAKAGELTSIRYCIGCMQGCTGSLYVGGPLECLVNPTLGREGVLDYTKTSTPKTVFVAGGGPGGMEAARAAALRGHRVTLFEKRNQLGGQFLSAAFPPGKGELATYTAWAIQELEKLNIDIKCGTELTEDIIRQEKPDTVIIATGGKPAMPPIKGVNLPHVVFAEDVLLGKVITGNNIVIAGGGEVGGETAAHLAMQQKNVTVIEMRDQILQELDGVSKLHVINILNEFNVKQYLNTKVAEITDTHVIVENQQGQVSIEADTVVLALGYVPVNELAKHLNQTSNNVVVIGGAVKTSNAMVAIKEGFDAGMAVV